MLPGWIAENRPLAPYTTLGIGGPARLFADVSEEPQLLEALEEAERRALTVFVLGGGSNLVVSDSGFPGLVIRIALHGRRVDDRSATLTAAAGEDWDPLVAFCVERNWAGIECLSGIPGTVGGTPIQNVGAYGQEVSEVITSVRAFDRSERRFVELSNRDCGFTYRTSIFNSTVRERYIVTSVSYALRPGGKPRIGYPDLERRFVGRREPPSLAEVREAVRAIRAAKSMLLVPGDPDARSAGSFFKNPIVTTERAEAIESAARRHGALEEEGEIPRFPAPSGKVKLPAAWLIERAGFAKGYRRGRVGISTRHTLAIVNRGGATAAELLMLVREIQERVEALYGIALVPEPVFVGFE
jgi:UDP-N-acetylmuramate dehydrogenase